MNIFKQILSSCDKYAPYATAGAAMFFVIGAPVHWLGWLTISGKLFEVAGFVLGLGALDALADANAKKTT